MIKLLRTTCGNSRYLVLFVISLLASLLFTFSGQLEMFSLGVITKKGPDFFELFAPIENNVIVPQNSITHKQLQDRFQELDVLKDGTVTKDEAEHFVAEHKKLGVVNAVLNWINKYFPIESNVSYLVIA